MALLKTGTVAEVCGQTLRQAEGLPLEFLHFLSCGGLNQSLVGDFKAEGS
jgi:hypothetical protein